MQENVIPRRYSTSKNSFPHREKKRKIFQGFPNPVGVKVDAEKTVADREFLFLENIGMSELLNLFVSNLTVKGF